MSIRHFGYIAWLTGLSGSGKTTISNATAFMLRNAGYSCYVLDGDEIRKSLNSDLGFSPEDRHENLRRISHIASILSDSGVICIVSTISPTEQDRLMARRICGSHRFSEVYLNTSIEVCESRDPKGLYKKARSGEIKDFTGIGAPYEPPKYPELTINNENGAEALFRHITSHSYSPLTSSRGSHSSSFGSSFA